MFQPKRILTTVLFFVLTVSLTGCFTSLGTISPRAEPLDTLITPDGDDSGVPEEITAVAPIPPHPLSIQTLRAGVYPGSDFVIEQTLDSGINYNRYIASYQSDGLKIYAMLTVPWEEKPATGFPVIIFNHGYIPPDEYRTTERYVAYLDAFARNGYIVIKSDYRGHGRSEGDAQSAYRDSGYVIDVLNGLASARRYPDTDPERIGMWGHSMGGYITLRAMVGEQNIKAGVIWAGVVASYTEMIESWFRRGNTGSSRPNWRQTLIDEYGTPADNPAFWESLSANSYLTDLSGPIQLHHGTNDTSVPYNYSTLLEEQIRAVGKHVEMFLYPGDDHNIAANRDDALTISVVFFDQYVKGMP